MNLRKLLAILLTLALLLGVAPVAGANGAVDGTTTFDSATVTPSNADSEEPLPPIVDDKIDVKITNIYKIQVNPYGMSIKVPGSDTETSSESIITAPMLIENNTGLKVDVTATATVISEGDVELASEPTRYVYQHHPLEDPDEVPSDKRVYLYLKITDQVDSHKVPTWPTETVDGKTVEKIEVITKDGGSAPLHATMAAGTADTPTYAALQIGGNTSLPVYEEGTWHDDDSGGFKVNLVLSFNPQMEEAGYTVRFDAADVWSWYLDEEKTLLSPVDILIKSKNQDGEEKTETAHTFDEGYTTHDKLTDGFTISAKENLTFTAKTRFKGTEDEFYSIHSVYLYKQSGDTIESLGDAYMWSEEDSLIVEKTYTINVAEVYKQLKAGETLYIRLAFSMVCPPKS